MPSDVELVASDIADLCDAVFTARPTGFRGRPPAGALADARFWAGRCAPGRKHPLGKLRDELTDAVNYLEVRLFPAPGSSVVGMGDPARFAYIGHRPYARASRKADEVLTFVVHPLIHADDNAGPGQA